MSNCLSNWIVHPLNYLTISSRTPEANCLSNDQFASFFCTFIVTGESNEVLHVILLMLRSIYFSSYSMMRRIASLSFDWKIFGRDDPDIRLDGQECP